MAQRQESIEKNSAGQQRLLSELERIQDIKSVGTAPEACGLDVVKVAPARGPVVPFVPTVMLPDGQDGYKAVRLGFRGRSAMRQRDVFDRMAEQSARHRGKPPFSRAQIGAARDYYTITEKCAAAGMKGSNMLQDVSGPAGGGGFMDAYLRDRARLERLHRAIGGGTSMAVRRVRPSVRGSNLTITDRALVDLVCISDMDLSAVLRRFKWIVNGRNRKVLRDALRASLDRMMVC